MNFASIAVIFCVITYVTQMSMGAPGGARQPRRRGGSFKKMPYHFKNICGVTGVRADDLAPQFKILNGTCAPYGAHPWMAQIQAKFDSDYEHHCGGTIITDEVILTAAHCFQSIAHHYMRVVVGQGFLASEDEEEMVFDIEDVIVHPHWDSPIDGRYSNDIALIKLRRKGDGSGIQFSDRVSPACLPQKDTPQKPGTECVISGWGKTASNSRTQTDCLQTTNVPLLGNDDCQRMYDETSRSISKGMMCAGFADGGTDTCNGDSGGPLACKVNGRFHITGIVSWGEGCGEKNRPGVYSKVKHYLKWIDQVVSQL